MNAVMIRILILLVAISIPALGLGIVFESNGYNNVIVSIHPDVPETNGQLMIANIKDFISQGSQKLFSASLGYAYINSVKILLPNTWSNSYEAAISSEYFYEDGNIRINLANPVYADTPYTLQPGGCEDPGEYIHLTPEYITYLQNDSQIVFGPFENIFASEWAKLRYGVFDEHGYPGDKNYPLFYYKEEIVNGNTEFNLKPNFCTNYDIEGRREDPTNGGACVFDPATNLPDENCYFVATGDNSRITSSLLATPFLQSTKYFSTDDDKCFDKPTKHNALCKYQSVWEVIQKNNDFQGSFQPMDPSSPAPKTTFEIIQPDKGGRFVLVLDKSGSMDDEHRMERLKQSSTRWIKYDLEEGNKLGVVYFETDTGVPVKLKEVNDANRDEFVDAINRLNPGGGTCLGNGMMEGMNVLNGDNDETSGGAIIFMTDGEQSCNNHNELDIDDSQVLDRIAKTKVRIITVAFGSKSDPRLENLATVSGGKTYFVKDGTGLEDINGVFEESNTYQPAVNSTDAKIIIVQNAKVNPADVDLRKSFTIDQTLGRDVEVTVDFTPDGSVSELDLYTFDGTLVTSAKPLSGYKTVVLKYGKLEPGTYIYEVKHTKNVEYALVTISSKAKDGETLPLTTKCWASADDFDASSVKLAVYAEVQQGHRPVLNAKVEALIESDDQTEALRIDLYDTGSGADQVSNDGIYGRYFSKYESTANTRFTLRCQVNGDENTNFVTSKSGVKPLGVLKSYPLDPTDSTAAVCCGSTIGENIKTEPTGNFTRLATGKSFKALNPPGPNDDVFPPGKVTDLKGTLNEDFTQVSLTFTAPGDDYDDGVAASYEIRYDTNFTWIKDENEWNSLKQIVEADLVSGNLNPINAGETVSIIVKMSAFGENDELYYVAMRAFDEKPLGSEISNIVSFGIIPPGQVADLTSEATNDGNDVTISFTAPGDDGMIGKAALYELKYSKSKTDVEDNSKWNSLTQLKPEDLIQGSLTPVDGGSPVQLKIKPDLFDADTDYFMAMKAKDERNTISGISNVASFVRLVPPNQVTDLTSEATNGGNDVSFSFTAPGDDGQAGTAAMYDLRYSKNEEDVENDSKWSSLTQLKQEDVLEGSLNPVDGGSKVQFKVKPDVFEADIDYYIAMKAKDERNTFSKKSNVASFVRLVPPGQVGDLSATATNNGDDVSISFTAPGDDGAIGKASMYDLRYSKTKVDIEDDSKWDSLALVKEEDLLDGMLTPVDGGNHVQLKLKPDHFDADIDYYLAMKAKDERNTISARSNTATFVRLVPPGKVSDLTSTATNNGDDVIISFTAPGDDGSLGTAAMYDLRYSMSKTDIEDDSKWNTLTALKQEDLIEGTLEPVEGSKEVLLRLQPSLFGGEIAYFVAMKAKDERDTISSKSNVATFERLVRPGAILDLKIQLDSSNVTLNFTAPGDDGDIGKVSRFELRFSEDYETIKTNWTGATMIDEDELIDGTLNPVDPGKVVEVQLNETVFEKDTTYFFAIKAFDEIDQASNLSNNATLFIELEDTGLSGGALAGIVLGSMVGGFFLVIGGYVLWKKM